MTEATRLTLDSWLVAGARSDAPGSPMNVPIVMASNFLHGAEAMYSREDGTPTVDAFESLVGGMEGGRAVAFSSGMGAIAAVFDQVPPGGCIAIGDDCYQGAASLAARGEERGRWSLRTLSLSDDAAWKTAVAEADLVWLESPSNPLLNVADLPAICGSPRRAGNLIAVDNTFATPFNQRPLSFGADVVMHSATKFISGHSDLLAGVVVVLDPQLETQLRQTRTLSGASIGALEAYLAVRGARTMGVRMERAQHNASVLAERLEESEHVTVVRYPGLSSHPDHDTAARTLDGYGAMIAFDVAGDAERATAVCERLRLIRHTTSLGGVESSIERRAMHEGQTHLPPTLLRMSVGCESVDDLWVDLLQAFEATA